MSSFVAHPLYGFPVGFSTGISPVAVDAAFKSLSVAGSKIWNWLETCRQNEIDIRAIHFDAVTMFGPNIGFLYVTAKAFDKENNEIPGICFIRGDSVCCLVIIEEVHDVYGFRTGRNLIVAVEEIKLPVGMAIIQTPAGMMDSSNSFRGKMIDELREETGIVLPTNIVRFTDVDRSHLLTDTLIEFDDFYPSQGGCDEKIKVFACVVKKTSSEVRAMQGSIRGNKAEHEVIKVHLLPCTWSAIDKTKDSKLIVAASKFDRLFHGLIRNE